MEYFELTSRTLILKHAQLSNFLSLAQKNEIYYYKNCISSNTNSNNDF